MGLPRIPTSAALSGVVLALPSIISAHAEPKWWTEYRPAEKEPAFFRRLLLRMHDQFAAVAVEEGGFGHHAHEPPLIDHRQGPGS